MVHMQKNHPLVTNYLQLPLIKQLNFLISDAEKAFCNTNNASIVKYKDQIWNVKKNLISLFHINSEPVLKFKSHSTSVIYSIMIVVNIIQGLFIVSVKVEMPVTHNVLQATSHTL